MKIGQFHLAYPLSNHVPSSTSYVVSETPALRDFSHSLNGSCHTSSLLPYPGWPGCSPREEASTGVTAGGARRGGGGGPQGLTFRAALHHRLLSASFTTPSSPGLALFSKRRGPRGSEERPIRALRAQNVCVCVWGGGGGGSKSQIMMRTF